MQGALIKATGAGVLACALGACSGPNSAALDTLPVRTTPQDEVPHSQSDPDAPLRGTAVAIDMAAS